MGVCEVLTIIFVACKALGFVSWSWGMCLLPEIIALMLYAIIFVVGIVLCCKANRF